MKHLCKECIHYGLCEYSTIIDEKIECKNFFPKIVCCKDCKYFSRDYDDSIIGCCTNSKQSLRCCEEHYCGYGEMRKNRVLGGEVRYESCI
jgi:hypothetical protein